MEQLLQRLRNQPLSQQLALAAAGCCLLATLTLVGVAAQSTQSIQNATLAEHADAAVRQLANGASAEDMEVGCHDIIAMLCRIAASCSEVPGVSPAAQCQFQLTAA